MLWIGLISGTSADAIDAALVRFGSAPDAAPGDSELLGFAETPLDETLRKRVHEVAQRPVDLRDLVSLDVELGRRFAEAAKAVARAAGVELAEVAGIASHGQTVGHYPDVPGSLQLAHPAVIHAQTGRPVVSDFRSGDLAAGGEGAPLTPFLHHARFAQQGEVRAVLNLGGFSNVTYLPGPDPDALVAFDPGPANALLDRAARLASDDRERFDRDGRSASRGQVVAAALEAGLADPYFAAAPPKSTGHEYFGPEFFERLRGAVSAAGGSADDLMATLVALSAESIARACTFFPQTVERWLLCGGGTRNPALVAALAQRLAPASVEMTDAHGVPAHAVEALTFATLGFCAARGIPSNLPAATGARARVVLGSATPPGALG